MFDKVFAIFSFLTCKNSHTKKSARRLTCIIQKLTLIVTCEEKNHTSIDMLKIEMTRITRQFKYYKPMDNLSH